MIPLHLRRTTVHISAEQADLLVSAAVAEWIAGVRALRSLRPTDDEVLAQLG
ncbi:MAG TPA: hypothetical protein VF549_18325 [Solirubrobacteraceae bacterium]|jgi:hypothetical protein